MADIKRLLNKKGWTGRELGIIELTNMALNFQQRLQGKEPKDLIDRAHFQSMISGISDKEQGRIYNGYIAIHEWLSLHFNIAQTQLQQAQLQFRTLSGYITQAILAEDVCRYIEQLPAIMTEKQYNAAIEAGRNSFLHGEDGTEERGDGLAALIERAICYYEKQLREDPAKANPLKAIRKKYVAAPVKSKQILDGYNEVNGEGYYTLPDGRRSDEMTAEEWQAAITTPAMREALTKMKATDGSGFEYTSDIAQERLVERAKIIFSGGTEEDADKAQAEREHSRGLSMPATWHYYEDPPTDLTKWDIVETGLMEYYGCIFCGMDGSEEEYLAELEDFLTEFRELVDVIIADIEKRYLTGKDPLQPLPVKGRKPLKDIASLPLTQWSSTVFSWDDLYSRDVYGFKAFVDNDQVIFDGNRRALFNGIAIIRPSDIIGKSPRIDERGNYIEPDLRHTLSNFTLEAFFPESEDFADNLEIVEDARETLLDSYYFVKGYNLALEMIAGYYDVPELTVFQMDLAGLEDKMDALNGLVPILYKKITDTDYRDKELQSKKLQVLKDLFTEIDYKALAIPEESIERARELFPDFQAFKTERADTLYNILCIRPQPEEDEGGLD